MSKLVGRLSSSFLAAFFVIVLPAPVSLAAQPKNVILFIGDGMGFEHVKAARFYNGGNLSFENLPNQGQVTTYSANNAVTDSAAAATAIATGAKVNNDVISVALPGDGRDLETMLELFKKRGKATGLITTAYLTHATPAGFGAHDPSRNNTTAIGNDLMSQTQPNILFGGGGNGLDLFTANSYGYQVATDTSTFNTLNTATLNLCALFGTGYMAYEEDYLSLSDPDYPSPHLTDMVVKALDALGQDADGFFLMVEAGRIDHAAHSNLLPEAVHETLELSRAVQAALNWIGTDPDTLLIVTADHETGGLQVLDTTGTAGFYPSVKWNSTGHTAANVPVYAKGPGAGLASGTMDNTDFLRLVTIEGAAQPFLYRVSVQDLTDTTATIVWNTDESCNSLVEIRPLGATSWTQFPDAALTTTHEFALTGLIPGTTYVYRVSSSIGSGNKTTSDLYTFTPIYDPSAPLTIIPKGSTWRYYDNGDNVDPDWRANSYIEDGSWQVGPAELGYGDGGENTILSYGPSASSKYPTYYFRKTFTVNDPAAYGPLSLTLLRDDGAIVYLNGTEVHRVNMPAGTVVYTTYASSAADYAWDAPVTINNLLVAGENVLAVEIHQGNASSSDLSFDLKLEAVDANNVQIVKGPWLQKVTPTSIVVMWETDGSVGSRVDYGLGSADLAKVEDAAPVQLHEVTLTGLLPNTSYRYTVASGYAVSTEATFQTAPATEDASFRFVVYSDTQVPAGHQAVVNSIMANNPLPRFVLHAGDLTDYGRTYSYWDTTFFTPAAAMLRQIPIFPALGNHEYEGNEQMWYFDFFNLPGNGTTAWAEQWYAFTYGSVRVIALNSSTNFAPGSVQYNWLVTELTSLASQSARWRVVFFHHPPFPDQADGLEASLVPLFHQYGVHLVFSGHNHSYRHVYRQPTQQDRVDYIITGGGGATLGAPLVSTDGTVYPVAAQSVYHHCVIDVSPGSLLFKAVDNSGGVIDSFTFSDVADTTPPVITGVAAVDVTDTTATITWTTDENANSEVQYTNKSTGARFEVSDPAFTTAHSILLTGLTPSTEYEFRVFSADPAENLSESSILTFTTKVLNFAPVAAAQTIALDEDTLAYITLGAADSNLDPLTYRIYVYPANGILAGDPPSVSYTPNANYSGPDSFQFVANDGAVDSAPATIGITINPIPDNPTAPTGLTATAGDGSITLNWGPGSDVDGGALTYTVYRNGAKVASSVSAAPYVDTRLMNGTTYSYKLQTVDSTDRFSLDSNEATATPMKPDYDAYVIQNPTLVSGTLSGGDFSDLQAVDGSVQTIKEAKIGLFGQLDAQYVLRTVADPSKITSLELVLNATLPASDDLPWKVFVLNGTTWDPLCSLEAGVVASVTPLSPGSYVAVDGTIRIAITDGADIRKETTDSLSIDRLYAKISAGPPVNQPPMANDQSVNTEMNTPTVFSLDAADADNDGLSISITQGPNKGNAALTGTSVTYTPNTDFTGGDSFTYTASDGNGGVATATVTISVTPVNQAPSAAADFYSLNEDIVLDVAAAGVLANDTDLENVSLLAVLVSGPANGALSLRANGSFTYTPNADFNGTDSFIYKASDGSKESVAATVTLAVTLVNDAPQVTNDTYSMDQGGTLTVAAPGVLGNDTDVDSINLTVTLFSGPSNGELTLNSDGSFSYTPTTGYTGTDTFTYHASDGSKESVAATVTIAVTPTSTTPQMRVANIVMGTSAAGKNVKATATVTIVDQVGNRVAGATVSGEWMFGTTSIGSVSGVTGAAGEAVLTSAPVKATYGTFFFKVTNVTLSGYEYQPSFNTQTEGSIAF